MFDGSWLSVLITERSGNLFATVKRSKYGKIIAETSTTASGDTIPAGPGTIYLGSSFGYDRLKGQLQELRLWNVELNQSYFNNHVKAPGAYNSADPYNELVFRLPLNQKINQLNNSNNPDEVATLTKQIEKLQLQIESILKINEEYAKKIVDLRVKIKKLI
jgi:hypothetical protein